MPKELKKRGRREEKKRKRQQAEEIVDIELPDSTKRQKSESATEHAPAAAGSNWYHGEQSHDDYDHIAVTQTDGYEFYGLLGEDDQAYFKRADQMIELNQFADGEERSLFLINVWKEAHGKELKTASSQSCSRFMERLIRMSSAAQLKALFRNFSGHFLSLVQHRFASHCVETLFLQCAPIVTEELLAPLEASADPAGSGEVYVSMENLFLYTVNELADSMGFLMTDSFASHTVRVLLVVLSGRSLESLSTSSLLHSKNKEKSGTAARQRAPADGKSLVRTVPGSFGEAVTKMTETTVGGLETNHLRALATQPLGNPVIQLLLEIELSPSPGKQKAKSENSLLRRLLPDDPLEDGTQSMAFLQGLLYDPVGSRLLETIVRHAPGKIFKQIYIALFRDNLGKIVRNDIAGYVAIKCLERLSHDDLEVAVEHIAPEIPVLLSMSRTSVIRVVIDRCRVRGVDIGSIAKLLKELYGKSGSLSLPDLLGLDLSNNDGFSEDRKAQKDAHDSGKLHSSLLVQTMLEKADELRELVDSGLLETDTIHLVLIAKDRTATHAFQASLTCRDQSKIFRRKIIQQFIGHVTELALDPVGSHLIDAVWTATEDLQYLRERVAETLLSGEKELRESFSGRAVWRNWMMDLYKRRKVEWIKRAKESVPQKANQQPTQRAAAMQEKPKSAIELARERFVPSKSSKPARRSGQAGRMQTQQTTTATVAH